MWATTIPQMLDKFYLKLLTGGYTTYQFSKNSSENLSNRKYKYLGRFPSRQ